MSFLLLSQTIINTEKEDGSTSKIRNAFQVLELSQIDWAVKGWLGTKDALDLKPQGAARDRFGCTAAIQNSVDTLHRLQMTFPEINIALFCTLLTTVTSGLKIQRSS